MPRLCLLREEREWAPRPCAVGLGHHDRQRSGPEAVLLVEAEVLGARCEGEQPGLPEIPALEGLEHGLKQPASDALTPEPGVDAERAHEAERAPARREHRPHHLAVELGSPGALGRRSEPRAHDVAISERGVRVGEAPNRPECQPHDSIRGIEVVGAHRPDVHCAPGSDASGLERHSSTLAQPTIVCVDLDRQRRLDSVSQVRTIALLAGRRPSAGTAETSRSTSTPSTPRQRDSGAHPSSEGNGELVAGACPLPSRLAARISARPVNPARFGRLPTRPRARRSSRRARSRRRRTS